MADKEHNQAKAPVLERRTEPRVKTNQPVLLRTPHAPPIEACLLDVSTRGVRLRASEPIPVGAAVRVDAQDVLLFGTITRCEPAEGAYGVGVALSRPLQMFGELRKLNESFLSESEPG